jgi:DNA-binding winged helix-turn-helix (wHTH) protein
VHDRPLMDQISPRVLLFDRFALNLTRGSLRCGEQEIELRPKAFEVLRHLVENAGRLVSKQELFEAVWPNVAVTDASLVQCIRELRQKLDDPEQRLIKTVSRRGYLLDVPVGSGPPEALRGELRADPLPKARFGSGAWRRIAGMSRSRKWPPWAVAAAIVICAALATIHLLARVLESQTANELFTQAEAWRAAAIARDKELPLPAFQIARVGSDIPAELRRFVGIWVSSSGFANSKRQFMLVITNVEKSGVLSGIAVLGPRQPLSVGKAPAGTTHFKARIYGDSFTYSGAVSERQVTLLEGGRLEFVETWDEISARGLRVRVVLDPVWTLVEAERAVAAQVAKR